MIGGTLLTGGYGYVLGSVVGVFVIAALRLIITKDGTINPEYLTIITGARPARVRAAAARADATKGELMAGTRARSRGGDRAVRADVAALHSELVRYGLVVWTGGNVSGRVPGADLFVIKPSGVSYDDLAPENMILCDLDGNVVPGTPGSERSPSSDTAAHAYVYRSMPEVGGWCTPTRRSRWRGRRGARRSRA